MEGYDWLQWPRVAEKILTLVHVLSLGVFTSALLTLLIGIR